MTILGTMLSETEEINLEDIDVPKKVEQGLSPEHLENWSTALIEEYNATFENKTWALANKPEGENIINIDGCLLRRMTTQEM